MKNKKKVIIWSCVAVAILAILILFGWKVIRDKKAEEREQVQEQVELDPEPIPEPEPEPEPEPVVIPIDFATLQAQNEDIYAWIQIPGMVIDYPLLQHPSDDAYYLDHTVERYAGLPGSIYTEPSYNGTDFTDRNTMIYGHNMKNGSMFGDLSDYYDAAFLAEHPEIIIYTPEHIYTYRIFATVIYDNRHVMRSFDFSTDAGLQEYIDSLKSVNNSQSHIDESVEVTAQDRLITLSTCTGNKATRFLVSAVLVDEK